MPRITNSMLVSNYMTNMQRNLGNMSTLQNQLSSGKNIQRASENPYLAVRSMQLNTEITANKQYNTNITDTSNWLDTTDTALGQANNIMKRIKELMIKAGNGAYGEDEVGAIKDEIVEKTKELGQVINTSFDGNFIFGGTKSTSKPVNVDADGNIYYVDKDGNKLDTTTDPTGAIKNQLNSSLKTEISDGVVVDYNKTAVDILEFKDKNGNNINVMDQLSDLIKCLNVASGEDTTGTTALSDGTVIPNSKDALDKINGDLLTNIDSISQNILKLRSNVGAMQNRMESAKSNNEDQSYNMTSILSQTEDIDFTEKTMEYSVMQTVYMATLQTSSKVLTNTLLDYIN